MKFFLPNGSIGVFGLVKSFFAKLIASGVHVGLFVLLLGTAGIGIPAGLLLLSHSPSHPSLPFPHAPSSRQAVLAATVQQATTKLSGQIQFNIPAIFNDTVTLNKGLTVNGTTNLNGDVLIKGQKLDIGVGTITASNILYSITPGTGISVGTGQTPTITNTGVTSLQGSTGSLSFTAGSGISLSGLTITNSDKGSSQNIFGTIAVTGSNSITAGSNTDTLTLTGGTGIALSTDTTNKIVTITSNVSATNLTGILPVAKGGTGDSTLTLNGVLYGNGTNAVQVTGVGTSGQVLEANGSGVPTWTTLASSNGPCSTCLVTNPSATQIIIPVGAAVTGLSVAQTATPSPTADIFNVTNTTGATKYIEVDQNGNNIFGPGSTRFSAFSSAGIAHLSSNGTLSSSLIDLSADVTNTLPVAHGGTGQTSLTTNGVLYGNNTSAVQNTGVGTSGQVLEANGSGVPTWTTLSISAGGSACTNCVATNPSGSQTITPTGNGTGLIVAQSSVATPSADIFDVTNSSGTTKFLQIDSNGNVIINNTDLQLAGAITMKIDDTNLANGNDTFVYDVAQDADGGAWEDNGNAQASSWYNEPIQATGAACSLATNTRCGNRAFPKKAIIIATNTRLYIFDAQTDTLWMTFTENTGYAVSGTTVALNAVYALNGVVYVATATNGLLAIDFINDQIAQYSYSQGNGGRALFQGNIANRNSNKGYGPAASWGQIASDVVNGVFARVIGGKIYIAASTLGGVSMINLTDQRVIRYIDN